MQQQRDRGNHGQREGRSDHREDFGQGGIQAIEGRDLHDHGDQRGPSDALAVIVTDNLPALQQAIYQSDTGGCQCAEPGSDLQSGQHSGRHEQGFNIYERINGSRGEVSNTASVASSTTRTRGWQQLVDIGRHRRQVTTQMRLRAGNRPQVAVVRATAVASPAFTGK